MSADKIALLIITACVIFGFAAIFIAWMIWPPHPDQSNVTSALVGALTAGYLQVITFWFTNKNKSE